MHSRSRRRATEALHLVALSAGLALASCDRSGGEGASGAAPHPQAGAAAPTNRVAIPQPVRRALGLRFVAVERRPVRQTLRVPGRFELLPDARQEVHATAAGRVELLKTMLDDVAVGDLLARVEAPAWRAQQLEMLELEQRLRQVEIESATVDASLASHEEHHESLEARIELWRVRASELEAMVKEGSGRAAELHEARAAWRDVQGQLAEHHEEVAIAQGRKRALEEEVRSIAERRVLLFSHMAALQGASAESLLAAAGSGAGARPRWQALDALELRASRAGKIESLSGTPGAWLEAGGLVLTIVQPQALWFRAKALESDLGVLREGARGLIAPPRYDGVSVAEELEADVRFALRATSAERSVELLLQPKELAPWARSGTHAFAEVIVREGSRAELAVPLSCILRDAGKPIFFRRDPAHPDVAVRVDADLGLDDGRWVEVLSGLADGDEVVLDGAFQLLLATSGTQPAGGHFHPDGSFHAEPDR